MRETILSTRRLSKTYVADGVQTHVLGSVDVELYKGDFTAIMGPSGSGKSTLLCCLSGMDAPTSGQVVFEGEDIARFDEERLSALRAQSFGFVFQAANLVSNLTLFENKSFESVPSDEAGDPHAHPRLRRHGTPRTV